MKKLLFSIFVAGAVGLIQAEDYTQWGYYKPVTINTAAASITADQVQFPLLVRLTSADADVFSVASASGADIRFAKADGTHLKYQVESWNAAAKSAAIWVRMDTVYGNNSTQGIRMYWGKPGAADSSNGRAVFDTANGFAGVWHLNDTSCADASSFGRNGVRSGTADTAGVIGRGRSFNPDNSDNVKISGLMGSPAQFTLSAWVNFSNGNGASQGAEVVSIGNYDMLRASTGTTAVQGIYHPSSWTVLNGGSGIYQSGWTHFVYTCNPAGAANQRQFVYLNGAQSGSAGNSSSAASYSGQGSDTYFGQHGNSESGWQFGGGLDEVRIEKVARSAAWIALCYKNQMPGSTLTGEGNTVQQGSGALPAIPQLVSPADGSTGISSSVALSWSSSANSTTYSVQVSTSAAFATTVTNTTGLAVTSLSLNGLLPNATYYWKVDGNNTTGAGNWSTTWSFSILPPAAPTLSSPANGNTISSSVSTVTIAWNSVGGAATYGIQVATVASFASTVLSASGLTSRTALVSVSPNTTYYWKAQAANVIGNSNWSAVWSFSVSAPAPAVAPTLLSPTNGAQVAPNQFLNMTWNTVPAATSYIIQVCTSSSMADSNLYYQNGTLLGVTIAESQYFWRVRGRNSGGTGPWSGIWTFSSKVPVLDEAAAKGVTALSLHSGVLRYTLGHPGKIEICMYDILGKRVFSRFERQNAGGYRISLVEQNLPAGRYVLKFVSGDLERRLGLVIAR